VYSPNLKRSSTVNGRLVRILGLALDGNYSLAQRRSGSRSACRVTDIRGLPLRSVGAKVAAVVTNPNNGVVPGADYHVWQRDGFHEALREVLSWVQVAFWIRVALTDDGDSP